MSKKPKIRGKGIANIIVIIGALIFLFSFVDGLISINGTLIVIVSFLILLLTIALAAIVENLAYIRYYLSQQDETKSQPSWKKYSGNK